MRHRADNLIEGFDPEAHPDAMTKEEMFEYIESHKIPCPKCGSMMVVKSGRYGKFLACPGFPDCRNTKPYLEKIGVSCPKCGKEVVLRRSSKGRKFYSCEGYPDCDYISWKKPEAEKEKMTENSK